MRVLRRRKFRWLPEFHSCNFLLGESHATATPMREWLVLWLWWGFVHDWRLATRPSALGDHPKH